jgi:hypothetical protein
MSTDTSVAALSPADQLVNGAKMIGDVAVLPGTSLLVDGNILEGGAHAIAGHVAIRLIGPVGWILVAVNSYSRSSTGSSLYEHISGLVKSKKGHKVISADTGASSSAPTQAAA